MARPARGPGGRVIHHALVVALPAVAARLLQDADLVPGQGTREPGPEIGGVPVQVGAGAPADVAGPVEDFLGPQGEDHLGAGRDPRPLCRRPPAAARPGASGLPRPGWG